jgi:tetratricopeptide (TPR) repeat protein
LFTELLDFLKQSQEHPDPEKMGSIRSGLGWAALNMNDYEVAIEHFTTATQYIGGDHLDALQNKLGQAEALIGLGNTKNWGSYRKIKLKEALDLLEKVTNEQTIRLGAHHLETLEGKGILAKTHYELRNYDKAAEMFKELSKDHPDKLMCLSGLAWAYIGLGRIEDAVRKFLEVIPKQVQLHDAESRERNASVSGLKEAYARLNRKQAKTEEISELLLKARRCIEDERRERRGSYHS